MSSPAFVVAASDAHVRHATPSANAGAAARLLVRGAGSGNEEYAYLHFTPPFPPSGATVLYARLHVFRSGAWTGTKTLNVRRVTAAWSESSLNYNGRPAVDAATLATLAANAGADKSEMVVDVTALMQDVANGAAYYGLRLDLTQDTEAAVQSSEAAASALRPVLEVAYSVVPDAPDHLTPDNNDATSKTQPLLAWQAAEQTSYQVQVSTVIDFSSTSLDTGKLAGSTRSLDTATTTLPAVATGSSRYWRVRVWNDADQASPWSAAAQWQRQPLAGLTISNPTATVPETTPPIIWAFSGTQYRWRATLYRVETDSTLTQLWRLSGTGTATAATPDPGLIVTGQTYQVVVDAWDNVPRWNDEHTTASQVFTYVRSGAPAPPTGLAVAPYLLPGGILPGPAVVLTWSRSTAPDYWALRVNGVEVLTRMPVTDCLVSGTSYKLIFWGLTPRVPALLEVEAVVQTGGPGTPIQHSGGNPTVSYTPDPKGIWLVDDSYPSKNPGNCVQLLGDEAVDFAIGEAATTYDPIGSQTPVRITDSIRGYEGNVAGILTTPADRDMLLELKAGQANQVPLRLILSDLSIPVLLEAVFARPTPLPGDQLYDCGFAFFQVADPWPVQ